MIKNRYSLDTTSGDLVQDKNGDLIKYKAYKQLEEALIEIYEYPEQNSLWWDDRDDAAYDMARIAGVALGIEKD